MDLNLYKYKVYDATGKVVTGTIEARDTSEAVTMLRADYPSIISITPKGKKGSGLNTDLSANKKISDDDLSLLCSQYATILKSGAQVVVCTKLIAKQTANKRLQEILLNVERDIASGIGLADAFEQNAGKRIPPTFYETIRAGENTGNIADAFKTLEEYFKKQSRISKQIKSALIYPIFIICVAVVVLIVVMAYVMPQMTAIFENMGGDIPGITQGLINTSNFFRDNVLFIVIGLVLLIVGVKAYGMTESGRYNLDKIKLSIPIFGKIQYFNHSAQYANTLAMLLKSGLAMTKSLRVLAKVFENSVFKVATDEVANSVEAGTSLGSAMKAEPCFPQTLTEMTAIGEKTGEIEDILLTTGDYFQAEADNATKNFLAKLEPILLCVIAAFAGFIVFAIYIPLFQMYDLY